jgi:tryptophanyl-tRNA synthetase
MAQRALTGIKPTGEPHLGNWLGAIRPALDLAKNYDAFYFIADYHALTTVHGGDLMRKYVRDITAAYLAFGLDPKRSVFYRQSDVPEIFELSWILSCFTPKGFMNRAHAYKDFAARNLKAGKDEDAEINMGLFGYPVLMSADILMFNADLVPVGADQIQHVEFARDIAEKFNRNYGEDVFHLPEPRISDAVKTIIGLDGRKMSKSYDNTIPLFLDEKPLQKRINQIVTNSQTPEEPKNPDDCHVFKLHQLLLDEAQENAVRAIYLAGGMGWGQAKKMFFETLNEQLKGPRAEYNRLLADPGHLDAVLAEGRDKARAAAVPLLDKVRTLVGVR